MTMMRSTDLCHLQALPEIEEYDLQKFYLKVKSVEALSDFI
jgi:hypothetical protein